MAGFEVITEVQPATKSVPLSSPACDDAWRRLMATRYSGASLPRWRVSRNVHLRALRSRTSLLQHPMP